MSDVYFEEIQGSPTLQIGREQSSATRIGKIKWDEIDQFVSEVMPIGQNAVATFPGKPWLILNKIGIVSFDRNLPGGTGPEPLAKVTLNYGTSESEEDENNEEDSDEEPFLNHRLSISGEFMTLPSEGLKWDDYGSAGEKRVHPDVHAGILIPIIEHTLEWKRVARPPFSQIVALVGTVSNDETRLFVGADAGRETTNRGTKEWTLSYKFVDKHNPTWNEFFRPETGAFERLQRNDGTPIYLPANHGDLFRQAPVN